MIDYFQAAHQLALGDSMTPALRRRLTDTTWMDSVPPQLRYAARTGSVSIPYLAFLVTHDTLFAAQVRGWSGAARNASDIEAILALDRGDTARALTIARGFPSIDTLRTGRFSLAGMRTIARAEVLERLGLDRLAAETYEAMSADRLTRGGLVDPGLAVWVRSFVAQGRLWAKLGERDKAIAAYEEFVRRWKDADGAAARQVEQVRGELARLRDTRPAR
jgi:hypothetical protein